jgi:serine/threonine protein kinase
LRDRLRYDMDIDGALDIAIQVASALVAAHRVNIVHRDLKPENIMIRHDDGLVKVLDFGLAKMLVPRQARVETGSVDREAETQMRSNTAPGVVMGTVAYMSPEQARGDTVDERADIWSLGVILYEMIAGSSPFVAATSNEIISSILSKETAPPLARYSRLVPERMEEIVEKTLAKNRDARYQTSKDLLIDLKRLRQSVELRAGIERISNEQRGGPTLIGSSRGFTTLPTSSLRPTSSAEYLATEINRHKHFLAGVLALLVIVGIGFGLYLYKYAAFRAPMKNRFASAQKLNFVRLTSSGKVRDVTISPDGRYAAYSVNENGKDTIRLRQTATNSDVEIVAPVETEMTNLSFTRDGTYLYYLQGGFQGTLFQVPTLGGSPKRIAVKVISGAGISPDGNSIAYSTYDGDVTFKLLLANLDGSNERALFTSTPPGWFAASVIPAWSPDGKTIAIGVNFTENGKQLLRLFGISVSDSSQRELSHHNWDDIFGVDWLANGNLIVCGSVYSNAETLPNQLWLVASPETEPQRVTNDLNDYHGVSTTANGDTLITLQSQRVANLWIIPNNDAARAEQITTASGISSISLTSDGRFIFVANFNLWTMNYDGTARQQLTKDQRNWLPSMTPDGRYIVYVSTRDNISHIWRMDADGTNQKQLTFGNQQWSPSISPDGEWVIYANSTGDNEITTAWKVRIEGGTPIQVSTSEAFQVYVSPSDGTMAFEPIDMSEGHRLTLVSAAGGEPFKSLTLPKTKASNYVRWTPNGRAIAFTDSRDGETNIWTVSVDGEGEAKPLTNFKTESIFDFAWSSDGKQLAVIRGTSVRDAVLISETN